MAKEVVCAPAVFAAVVHLPAPRHSSKVFVHLSHFCRADAALIYATAMRDADTVIVAGDSEPRMLLFPHTPFSMMIGNNVRIVDPTVLCCARVSSAKGADGPRWTVRPCPPSLFLAQRLLVEFRARNAAAAARAQQMFADILKAHPSMATDDFPNESTRRRSLIDRAKAHIAARVSTRLTLDDLCAELRCSPFHLCRTFRDVEGLTVTEYRHQLRLRAAVDRLLSAPVSGLTSLALELGYSSHSHFTLAFRRTFAVTPSRLLAEVRRAG
ncbi:MAG TPA: AraC family transcriptional regulator [Vicinamibacterales bacterium]|nr:AraC family transcriptional regulator [Vicinamibacterales bacterium]